MSENKFVYVKFYYGDAYVFRTVKAAIPYYKKKFYQPYFRKVDDDKIPDLVEKNLQKVEVIEEVKE